jgi:hypothetical protein
MVFSRTLMSSRFGRWFCHASAQEGSESDELREQNRLEIIPCGSVSRRARTQL